ncbi:N-acetylmuramoyl-L-alanine amidase family protein, partial [Porcipelethomonas sp.]|uniref:N-acetylmuramoyl-L-alanine amidase family protein n=1 Tax=Porcipelethomonas sp. TaxID=2981675 RepID=UPI003EF8C8A4
MKLIRYLLSAAAATAAVGTLWICACGQETETAADVTEPSITDVTESITEPAYSDTSVLTSAELTYETTVSLTDANDTTITTEVSSEESGNGWNLINGRWFYYSDGVPASGTLEIDGETYLFAPNGALKTDWQTINSLRIYFDYNTHSPVYGWIDYMDNLYYCDKQSGKFTGMHDIDGQTYIFNEKGILQTGFIKYESNMYYGDENGVIVKGDYDKSPITINGCDYIISPAGRVQLGWQTVNGIRLYFDYETANPMYGWINYMGKYYYIDSETGKYTGDQYINNHPYRFDKSGIIQTGFQSFKNGKTCYYYEDHTWAVGFLTIKNDTYYFDNDGFMATGWKTINKKKYYFGENGKMSVGLVKINGNKYYFNQKGVMQTGFIKINGNTYYFNSDGKMVYNWQTINKNKYYFGSDGIMKTGWQTISKNKYYFGSDGIMKTGLQTINKNKYYFGSDGIMKTGLQTINKNKYYFGSDGVMKTGWQTINKNKYYFGT